MVVHQTRERETMTTIEQFITPGLDDVRAGYDHLRALGVDASAAADWLTDHVRTVARDDLAAQMERAQAQFVADGSTDTEHRRMRRALQTAVKIYNRHRHRLTAFDVETGYVVTTAGAAAVNRAAVVREIKAPQEAPAILGRANAQAITGPRPQRIPFHRLRPPKNSSPANINVTIENVRA